MGSLTKESAKERTHCRTLNEKSDKNVEHVYNTRMLAIHDLHDFVRDRAKKCCFRCPLFGNRRAA